MQVLKREITMNRRLLIALACCLLVISNNPALAQTFSVGINAPIPNYWTYDAPYVDVLMHSSGWWGIPSHNTPALTSTGYPSQPGSYQCFFYINGYQSGIYNFYGEGDFNISVSGVNYAAWPNNGFVPGTLKKDGNITTGQVQVMVPPVSVGGDYNAGTPNHATILLSLTVTNANNPPNNFHLIRPDYPAWPNTNAIFGKEYLQAYGPFCCIRFMDWMGTNNSKVTNWASRPDPNKYGCANAGSCYENMIELCNETNCDMWINVPLYATDDWAQNMANLIKQKLKSNLHVYVEVSNELWNWGFHDNWQQVETWDQSNSALTTTAAWARHGQEVAYLLMHFISIMRPTLGNQLRPVLAGQVANTIYCSAGLQWIQQTYGPPSNYIYGIAGAPYFGGSGPDIASLDSSMNAYINTNCLSWIQQNAALAKSYNVKFLCYEGGQSLVGTQSNFALMASLQYDPVMGAAYQSICNILKNNGADLCCFYNLLSGYSRYGFWGALEDIRQLSNPPIKYSILAGIAAGCDCGNAPSASPPSNNSSGSSNNSNSGNSGSSSVGGNVPSRSASGPNPGNTHSGAGTGNTGSSGSQSIIHYQDLRPAGQMGGPIRGSGGTN